MRGHDRGLGGVPRKLNFSFSKSCGLSFSAYFGFVETCERAIERMRRPERPGENQERPEDARRGQERPEEARRGQERAGDRFSPDDLAKLRVNRPMGLFPIQPVSAR